MNIEKFRQELTENIISRYPKLSVKNCDAIKNNGVKLCGICIGRKDEKVFPSIYIENYYKRFCLGDNLDCIIDDIIKQSEECQYKGEFDTDFYSDYERIKKYLRVKLINTEKNKELLCDTPNREFLDLSIVAYCDLSDVLHMEASILVKNTHVGMWGISADELIDTAFGNSKKERVSIRSMNKIFPGAFSDIDCLQDSMYVMNLARNCNGAVCMCFDDILDEFLKDRKCGVYILPSSIHEVILLTEDMLGSRDEKDFSLLVESVNRECLESVDVLSDHAYYYSSTEGYLFV